MKLITVKLLVMSLSGVVRIFFGMFPLVVVKTVVKKWSKATDERMKKVISVLMFFGGGVLLATCFLHMMPEVRSSFAKAEPKLELPFSEIIFLAGFFLVYIIEDIVHSIVHKRMHNKEVKNVEHHQGEEPIEQHKRNLALSCGTLTREDNKGLHNDHDEVAPSSGGNACAPNTNNITSNIVRVSGNEILSATTNKLSLSPSTIVENEHRINPNSLRETKEIFRKNSFDDEIPGLPKSRFQNGMGGITNGAFVSEKFQYCDPDWWKDIVNVNSEINLLTGGSNCTVASCTNLNGNKSPMNIHHHPHQDRLRAAVTRSSSKENNNGIIQNNHSHMHLPMDDDSLDQSIGGEIRNILIVVAISFHGIFEGMAIGLQSSEIDVWYLFMAVSLHECTILFCIGVELISSKTKVFRMVIYILVVSLVSPLGIAIGILVTEKAYGGAIHQALVIGCFQGLAAGTLLYVTFFEIFQEEGRKLHRKSFHILVAVLGFILMGSLEFLGGHDHAGGHSHSNSQNKTISDDHDEHNHTHLDSTTAHYHGETSHSHNH